MGFMDGGLSERDTIPKVVERVRSLVDEVKPDVLITWGPDGLSGHPDHRMISAITTQVFEEQSELKAKPQRLYYVAIPESVFENIPPAAASAMQANLVDEQFVTAIVDGSSYTDRSYRAIQCHKTQWPPAAMEMMGQLTRDILGGKVYLRLAMESSPRPPKPVADILP
jgi:LmbE family N-acetylglucosaminyl deacetylase